MRVSAYLADDKLTISLYGLDGNNGSQSLRAQNVVKALFPVMKHMTISPYVWKDDKAEVLITRRNSTEDDLNAAKYVLSGFNVPID